MVGKQKSSTRALRIHNSGKSWEVLIAHFPEQRLVIEPSLDTAIANITAVSLNVWLINW